jgi:hypothetical protein
MKSTLARNHTGCTVIEGELEMASFFRNASAIASKEQWLGYVLRK